MGKKIIAPPPKTSQVGISKKPGTGYSRTPPPSMKGSRK